MVEEFAKCIGCGCNDNHACEGKEGPCGWIIVDYEKEVGVCSECAGHLVGWIKRYPELEEDLGAVQFDIRTSFGEGARLIAHERWRQITDEGFGIAHDDEHTDDSLAMAAACYAAPREIYIVKDVSENGTPVSQELHDAWPDSWPYGKDKRDLHTRIHQLEIAGALIAAEIDRLLRAGEDKDV